MASTIPKTLSAEEFWDLPENSETRLELIEGEVAKVPGSSMKHSAFVALIFSMLRAYVRENRLGQVFPDGLAYLLRRDPDTIRIPDVSFIPGGRLPQDGPSEGYATTLPGLVVEVVSPGNDAIELRRRTRDYIDAGVTYVWIVWPDDQSVSVYTGDLIPIELDSADTLDGGDVLPGFSVTVAELFDIEW